MRPFEGPPKWVLQIGWWGKPCILLLITSAWALDIPPLTGRVLDHAHILSPASLSDLNATLAEHESKTS